MNLGAIFFIYDRKLEYQLKKFDPSSIIIGFTGSFGSGCSLIAKTLAEKYNYYYYSLSEYIHKYAIDNNIQN